MKRMKITMPFTDTLEGLVVQLWDALRHYRSRLGSGAYVEGSFERDGKAYTVRITEVDVEK